MAWWGHGNVVITDASIKDIAGMIMKLRHLKFIKLNLDKWAKKNSKITEKSVKELSVVLQSFKNIDYVELNLDEYNIYLNFIIFFFLQ